MLPLLGGVYIPATIEMTSPAYMTGETRRVKISSRVEISTRLFIPGRNFIPERNAYK